MRRTKFLSPKPTRMRSAWSARALATLLLMTSGCKDAQPERESTVIDTLPNGRRIVSNTAPTWSAPTAWRLEEDLRIGPASDGPASFNQIQRLLVDSAGRIYMYDEKAIEIRVFLPSG